MCFGIFTESRVFFECDLEIIFLEGWIGEVGIDGGRYSSSREINCFQPPIFLKIFWECADFLHCRDPSKGIYFFRVMGGSWLVENLILFASYIMLALSRVVNLEDDAFTVFV